MIEKYKKYQLIYDTIIKTMIECNYTPTRREIAKKLNMAHSTVILYIKEMEQKGLIKTVGKSIITVDTSVFAVPVLNSLSDPNHIFSKADIKDFLFISRKLIDIGGELAMLTIPDNSMIKANIKTGDILLVKRQNTAEYGQLIFALSEDNKFYLRRLIYDEIKQKGVLVTEDNADYPIIENYEIRAIALKVISDVK